MHPAIAVAIAYAAGSIPSAHLAGKSRGIDLRTQGSGNLGATNVFRVLGAKVGILVFLVDAAKGALPTLLLPAYVAADGSTLSAGVWALLLGLAAIAGHVRPLFLGFRKGGKGVATAAGVFFALAPVPMAVAFGVFVAVVLLSGYVSLGSLTAAVALVLCLFVLQGSNDPVFGVAAAVACFVFWTHRANIGRLRRGEEHRFGRRGGAPG